MADEQSGLGISSQIAAQQALAHLAAIVESSDDAIISKSLDGTILSWNNAARQIFGYSAPEIIGQSILKLIPPERQDEEKEIVARLRKGERIDHFNTVRLRRDGRRLEVVVSISPVKDAAGKIIGASKVLRSLTPQRLAEQARLDSEARLRGVVDNAVDGIFTIDEKGTIESINIAGVRIFGYTVEELMGQNIKRLMPETSLIGDNGHLADHFSAGQLTIGVGREVVGRRKDGSEFPMDLAVSQVQLADRRLFTGIVRDITQRKQAEMALVQARDAAEAASRAKEHFLSVLSHELRTPLTPVLAELSFIEDQAELPAELKSRLAMVRRNIETEARLVDDLLDLTRISRGKVELHYEVVDLHEAIRGAVAMFQSAIDAKSQELSLALRARQHHVWADPGRLQQVLINLISNAVKFTGENGAIWINSANVLGEAIEIEISDNGVGIENELLSRLFSAFEQSEQSRRLGGLGLGLSIAKSLAEMHRGKLTAVSDGRDRGSTFQLTLATMLPKEKAVSPPSSVPIPKFAQRILLVEDHADTRIVIARLLTSIGCQVTTAGCVSEALAAAETGTFDLLISDIGLPDGTGLDVMRSLKSRIDRGIALSGFGQEEDLRRSIEAGFEMHLIKPINFNTLKEVLRKAG